MAPFLLLLLLAHLVAGQFSTSYEKYNMEEFKEIDEEKFDYEGITDDDIFEYGVHFAQGVKLVDYDFYINEIYSLRDKPDHKPWFISIVYKRPRVDADHSNYLIKSLYFLVRDYSHEVNVGILYTDDELTREAFEFRGIPQTIFIKGGKPYYIGWAQIGINRLLEFMHRYYQLKEDAFDQLYMPPNRITIYKDYYSRWIGFLGTRYFYMFLVGTGRDWWQMVDPTLKHWPSDWLDDFKM
jgi:hypothetical protein